MSKTKIKKWTKRILIGLLIATALSVVAPVVMNRFVENTELTAHAAEAPTPDCKPAGETSASPCKKVGDSCPTNFTESNGVCTQPASTTVNQQTLRTMEFLVQIQTILNRLLWPVLVMIGGLTDNSLLFGNGMEDRLREIWIPIRNIVNILFVVALVGIALYNVLGIGDENSNYSIKAILPKIIVGIIVVNFSFLGIKVFLDGINVLTTAIFALPNQITGSDTKVLDPTNENHQIIIDRYCRGMNGKDFNEVLDYVVVQKETEDQLYRRIAQTSPFNLSVSGTDTKTEILNKVPSNQKTDFEKTIKEHQNGTICVLPKNSTKYELTTKGEVFLSRWNARNASLALALGLSKVVLYQDLNLENLKDVEKIFVNTVLSLMMYLLFAASFIALFVVLLGRLVVMWLAIAVSPILLLGMAIPAVKENVSGFGEIQSQFIKNAIAPLGIALSLSVGWIMLKALQGLNSFYTNGSTISFSATKGIPVVGLTTLQDLMVGVGTLAVIWLGVFTAASNTIAAPVTDWMKNGLSRAGQWIGTLPLKHAPIFHIDLPGVEGKENYTGTQVMEALNQFTAAKEPGKLANLLTGKQRVYPKDLGDPKKTKTADAALNWLKNAKGQNMSAKDLQTAMAKMRSGNSKLWNSMKTSHPSVWKQMDAMRSAPSKKREAAKKALLEHHQVAGASGINSGTKGTPPTVNNISVSNTVNGKPLEDDQVKTVKPHLTNLSTVLAPDDPAAVKKNEVEKYMGKIRDALPGATASDLKNILGKPVIDKLEKVYGKTGVDKALLGK